MNAPVRLRRPDRIDAEARGKLRVFRKRLTADYAAIRNFTDAMKPETVLDFMKKKGLGRRRVFARINNTLCRHGARLVVARLLGKKPVAVWALLEPREAVRADPDHPRDDQDCVCVNYLLFGWAPDEPLGSCQEGVWTLEITMHALGRTLQRSRSSDPAEVVFAVHDALLSVGDEPLQQFQFDLRVGDHVLVCELRGVRSYAVGTHLHVLIRTYLEFDQIPPRREAGLIVANGAPAEWLFPHPFKVLELRDGGVLDVSVAEDAPQFTNGI